MSFVNTSGLPHDLVKEVVRFVMPSGMSRVSIGVERRPSGHASGCAWKSGHVVVRINPDASYPFHWNYPERSRKRGYCFDEVLRSPEEALVMVMAHELRHEWQFGVGGATNLAIPNPAKTAGPRRYVRVMTPKIVYDPSADSTVVRGRTTYHHARVVKVPTVRRAPPKRRRGQLGGREHDADCYAMKMLREWRRAHSVESWWGAASPVSA